MSSELSRMRKCFQPWQFYVDHWINSNGEYNEEEFLMWVYQPMPDGSFQVGYFLPIDKTWVPDGAYATREDAAARVNYLNGGHRG